MAVEDSQLLESSELSRQRAAELVHRDVELSETSQVLDLRRDFAGESVFVQLDFGEVRQSRDRDWELTGDRVPGDVESVERG